MAEAALVQIFSKISAAVKATFHNVLQPQIARQVFGQQKEEISLTPVLHT